MSTQPSRSERWTLAALGRAVEGAVVIVDAVGQVVFHTDGAAALLGDAADFERCWSWLQERIDDVLDGADLSAGEVSFDARLPTEPERTIFVRLLPAESDDEAGYIAILKHRQALDALQRDLQLASQMRRVSETMAQAAHDLKAPLNALSLNVEVVRQQLRDDAEADAVLARLDLLDREISRLNRMLQMVLSQTATPRATARRFDLRRLVREVVALVRAQAQHRRVTIKTALPERPTAVLGARDHLKQALINLVMNGLEAMPDGGHLRLTVTVSREMSELRIADTGHGIPADVRDRLFKLHFTTKKTGSGIGLFTARATIQTMGGSLALESEDDRGTCAVVRLPLVALEPDQEAACSTS